MCRDDRGADAANRSVVLAVGAIDHMGEARAMLGNDANVTCARFSDISAGLLKELSPAIVVSPVVATGFDCLELAQVLEESGYGGPYRAVASDLPDPAMIRREIRSHCPTVDFDVMPPASSIDA